MKIYSISEPQINIRTFSETAVYPYDYHVVYSGSTWKCDKFQVEPGVFNLEDWILVGGDYENFDITTTYTTGDTVIANDMLMTVTESKLVDGITILSWKELTPEHYIENP